MSEQQQMGIFIAATAILWAGYFIGYRCRMYEDAGSFPAWCGLLTLGCLMAAGVALVLIILLVLDACGLAPL